MILLVRYDAKQQAENPLNDVLTLYLRSDPHLRRTFSGRDIEEWSMTNSSGVPVGKVDTFRYGIT